ncbi:MAG: hypothetical protein M3308_06555 [Actinomycetota bacterium]|nr:hypothetical protein [Actinomycetota bacterium]
MGNLRELRYVLYEAKGDLTLVREPGEDVADPEIVRIGLQDAADFPAPTTQRTGRS